MIIKLKPLILNILIAVGAGFLSSFLVGNFSELYTNVNTPDFAPPAWIFPVVWTVLYILMGVSAYLIGESKSSSRNSALLLYYTQLIVNIIWPLLFFLGKFYFFSFIWILILWALVIWMIFKFYKINKLAALLQIPYLLWLTFAAYLNLNVALLN